MFKLFLFLVSMFAAHNYIMSFDNIKFVNWHHDVNGKFDVNVNQTMFVLNYGYISFPPFACNVTDINMSITHNGYKTVTMYLDTFNTCNNGTVLPNLLLVNNRNYNLSLRNRNMCLVIRNNNKFFPTYIDMNLNYSYACRFDEYFINKYYTNNMYTNFVNFLYNELQNTKNKTTTLVNHYLLRSVPLVQLMD